MCECCGRFSVPQILIIGGMGQIGRAIAGDLLAHTNADLILTGRRLPSSR
ncbi:MAG: KR domain-containing protein, partial [Prochlorothrix sp.]